MSYATIDYQVDDAVATLTLSREERLNALSRELIGETASAIDSFEADGSARVLLVTGAGRAFCAGADIKERAENPGDISLQRTSSIISPLFRRIETLSKVAIAAINGPAIGGGCELAMACDLRIASERATFALPEARLGILPGAGGTQRLPRLIGQGRAKEMMLLGTFIDAQTAHAWGLVNRVTAHEVLMDEARAMADALLRMAPLSLSLIKSAVDLAANAGIDEGLAYEQECSQIVAESEDRREGYRAFVEKRPPRFIGR